MGNSSITATVAKCFVPDRIDRIWSLCGDAKWEQAREAIPTATREQIEYFGGEFSVTSLHWACGHNAPLGIIRMLVNRGADVGKQAGNGYWNERTSRVYRDDFALHTAIRAHCPKEVILLLLEHMPRSIGAQGHDALRPLQLAVVVNSSIEILSVLLDYGADFNMVLKPCYFSDEIYQELVNVSPFYVACVFGRDIKKIQFLLDRGAKPDIVNDNGSTPLLFLCKHFGNLSKILPLIKLLLDRGANVNHETKDGSTALMLAIESHGSDDLFRLLIEHGADVNSENKNGSTVLIEAIKNSHSMDIVRLLMEHGADVNYEINDGSTALMLAIKNRGSDELIRLLIEHGADVNSENRSGSSVLTEAIKHSRSVDIVRLLMEHGADECKKDKILGKNAIEIAYKTNHAEMIDLLENYPVQTLVLELFKRAGIVSVTQQRTYSRILKTEGIDRLEILIKATPEGLKATGIKLGDAIAILEAVRTMRPKEDVPFAEEVN